MTMPSTPGDYEFRLFLDNGYQRAATSVTITVGDPLPEPAGAALAVDVTTATPGQSVTVTLTNGLGGSGDWLSDGSPLIQATRNC